MYSGGLPVSNPSEIKSHYSHASTVCIIHHLFFPNESLMHPIVISNNEKLSCTNCNFKTRDKSTLIRHKKRKHGYIPSIRRKPRSSPVAPTPQPPTDSSYEPSILSSKNFPFGEISSSQALPSLPPMPPSLPCQQSLSFPCSLPPWGVGFGDRSDLESHDWFTDPSCTIGYSSKISTTTLCTNPLRSEWFGPADPTPIHPPSAFGYQYDSYYTGESQLEGPRLGGGGTNLDGFSSDLTLTYLPLTFPNPSFNYLLVADQPYPSQHNYIW